MGRLEEALDCYNESLKTNYSYDVMRLKAKLLEKMGRLEEALDCINKSLQNFKNDTEAFEIKAGILENLARAEAVASNHDKARSLQKEAMKYRNRAALNKRGKASYWIRYGEMRLADALYFSDLKKALKNFDRALEKDPTYYKGWMFKGIVLRDMGCIEEALQCFDRAIELGGMLEEPWLKKGMFLHELGKLEDAEKCFKRARKRNEIYDEERVDEEIMKYMKRRKVREDRK